MNNIWQKLSAAGKPFFALAPLDDVTDTVFRQIINIAGRPDVYFTEFTSADAFVRGGFEVVEPKLRFTEEEQPLIAQIWGHEPAYYSQLTTKVRELGFSGVDINMGCPEKNIVRNGCCSALIRQPEKAAEIIAATREAAGNLPVSVKTRVGFDRVITEEWAEFLLRQDLDALIIHGRTAKEMSKVPARWDEIAKVVKLRDRIAPGTIIIGNGDVLSRAQGEELAVSSGADGIMIGRGVFQNIFIFDESGHKHSQCDRLKLLLKHLDLHEREWGGFKRFEPLKKFFKIYVHGFDGAARLRATLMATSSYDGARDVVNKYLEHS